MEKRDENKEKRVILVAGDNSKWFDQAIFIVRKALPPSALPVDFVVAAENIVAEYIATGRRNSERNKEYVLTRAIEEKADISAPVAATSEASSTAAVSVKSCRAKDETKKAGVSGVDLALNIGMLISAVILSALIAMAFAAL
ncbi:MAG: hypothetical protein LBK41_04025 [Clostridiales bacterium]|jgi:hypothetical protein|nr:hypothetical protein [Clostridiales bacterium]